MPYALIAPITSVPSSPRLMRPERSVMHSPRLTNRNGVETRMAPPNTASGTVHRPIVPSAISGFAFQETNSPVQRVAREHEDKDNPLQHLNRGVRRAEPALQEPAAGADSAQQYRNGNDRQRILPRQEGDEDAGESVAGREVGVGAALHRGDFDHAGEAGRCARQKADGHDQLADTEPDDSGGANIAAGNARRETEHGMINQDVGRDGSDDPEHQSPMYVGTGYRSQHVGGADLACRRLVEAGGVAHHALDQMVEDRQRDVDQKQA